MSAFLYRHLASLEHRRLTYRFVYVPETIGTLAYLSLRGEHLKKRLVAGYVLTCIGDRGPLRYKRSRRGDSLADRAAAHVLTRSGAGTRIMDFAPLGSDERQYCSPGFNLPVGSLMRTMYGTYREYHTSLDNREFVSFEAMAESVALCAQVLRVLDLNVRYRNLCPYGEPHLSRRGLCPTLGVPRRSEHLSAIKWVLNYSDGEHDLLWIADRSGLSVDTIDSAAQVCRSAGLLERAP